MKSMQIIRKKITKKQINTTQRFECRVCHKLYKHKSNLKTHFNMHTTNAYVCEFCNKRFGRRSNWEEHLRTHTGEAPFKCQICKRRFKQKHALKNHQKNIHRIKYVVAIAERSVSDIIQNPKTDCTPSTRKKQTLNDNHLKMQPISVQDPYVEKIVSSAAMVSSLKIQRMISYPNKIQSTIGTITQPFNDNKCGNAFADDQKTNPQTTKAINKPFNGNVRVNAFKDDNNLINCSLKDTENQYQACTPNPFSEERIFAMSPNPITPYFTNDDCSLYNNDYNNIELSPVFTSIKYGLRSPPLTFPLQGEDAITDNIHI